MRIGEQAEDKGLVMAAEVNNEYIRRGAMRWQKLGGWWGGRGVN